MGCNLLQGYFILFYCSVILFYFILHVRPAVTDILSRTVSELSQLIVQILGNMRFEPPFGELRNNVLCSSWAHWKARSRLAISVN